MDEEVVGLRRADPVEVDLLEVVGLLVGVALGGRRLEGVRGAPVGEKLEPDLREQRVGEYVVQAALAGGQFDALLRGLLFQLATQGVQFVVEPVRRAAGERLVAFRDRSAVSRTIGLWEWLSLGGKRTFASVRG